MAYLGNKPVNNFVSFAKQDITGSGGTSYSLDYPVTGANDIELFINNVRQEPTEAYSCSGSTLTLTEAVSSSDDVYAIFRGRALQTAQHPSDSALEASQATISGDLTVDTNTLHVDSSTNNVGIGTVTPDIALTVEKSKAGNFIAKFQNTNSSTPYGVWVKDAPSAANNYPLLQATDSAGTGTYFKVMSGTGYVTMPYQPAFHVYRTSTIASGSYITHNVYPINNGGHYNSTNGKFTAPVSGNYMFYATGLTQPTGGTSRMRLVKNGSTTVSGESRHQGGTAGAYLHATIQAVVYLAASDWVQQYYINDDGSTTLYSDSTPYITFGGHLIG